MTTSHFVFNGQKFNSMQEVQAAIQAQMGAPAHFGQPVGMPAQAMPGQPQPGGVSYAPMPSTAVTYGAPQPQQMSYLPPQQPQVLQQDGIPMAFTQPAPVLMQADGQMTIPQQPVMMMPGQPMPMQPGVTYGAPIVQQMPSYTPPVVQQVASFVPPQQPQPVAQVVPQQGSSVQIEPAPAGVAVAQPMTYGAPPMMQLGAPMMQQPGAPIMQQIGPVAQQVPSFLPPMVQQQPSYTPPIVQQQPSFTPMVQPQTQVIQQAPQMMQAPGMPQQVMGQPQPPMQAIVKQEVGPWQICEDQLGDYYVYLPSGQTFDQMPPELMQLLQQQPPMQQQLQPQVR